MAIDREEMIGLSQLHSLLLKPTPRVGLSVIRREPPSRKVLTH